ncbi:MAG TPA: winged helix-turn-helix domain-containing protein [Stellaceae bacterium]|nr:winged helix-turn-helix domain-containing protein [Stellaceae bacterium]
MRSGDPDSAFLFGEFRLDRRRGGLFRVDAEGTLAPVAVGSRALDLLQLLVERQGEVVLRDEIMAAVWHGTTVEDCNLPTQIAALRRVLDAHRPEGSFIQTVAGQGYRFIGAVVRADPPRPPTQRHRKGSGLWPRWRLYGAFAILVVLAVGRLATGWSQHWPSAAEPPLPSIAVLPFANLSNDPAQQYLADGITDDIRTELSRLSDVRVISRGSLSAYRSDISVSLEVGREPGARYLLQGSVHELGDRLRINARLIDAATGAEIWAELFDHKPADLFTVEDEVTRRIAITLNLKMIAAAAGRSAAHPSASDYVLRGRAAMLGPFTRENLTAAIADFEHALALDPSYAGAKSMLASTLVARAMNFHPRGFRGDIVRATRLADEGLAAAPQSPEALIAKGQVLRWEGRYRAALRAYQTAFALDDNNVIALALIGQCRLIVGPLDDAIPTLKRAISLSPRNPIVGHWYAWIGWAYLLQGRADEAVDWLERANDALPGNAHYHSLLASAYGLAGEGRRAAAELAEAHRLYHDGTRWSVAHFRSRGGESYLAPEIRTLFDANVIRGWRQAGLPEQ